MDTEYAGAATETPRERAVGQERDNSTAWNSRHCFSLLYSNVIILLLPLPPKLCTALPLSLLSNIPSLMVSYSRAFVSTRHLAIFEWTHDISVRHWRLNKVCPLFPHSTTIRDFGTRFSTFHRRRRRRHNSNLSARIVATVAYIGRARLLEHFFPTEIEPSQLITINSAKTSN